MTDLRNEIDNIFDVPAAQQNLYAFDGGAYKLTPGGKLLKKVRTVLDAHRSVKHAPESIWSKPAEVALKDWTQTISAATVDERRGLLQLAASGRVTVKREGT